MAVQIIAAVALVFAAAAYSRYARARRDPKPPSSAYLDATSYRAAIVGLPDDSKAAETFAGNAAALYKTYNDSVQAIDGKIGTLLGYVGGGTSVLALLSGTDKVSRPALTPLLGLALAALAIVFYCALDGLRPRTRPEANVSELCDLSLLRSMSGNTRMHALMAWEYLDSARQTVPILFAKADWLKRCYRAFAVGVVALVVNAVLPIEAPAKPHPVTLPLSCTGSPGYLANCMFDLTEVPK